MARIHLLDKKLWFMFVYQVLYTALLGSMLYDFFGPSFPWPKSLGTEALQSPAALKFLILACYLIDYAHLYVGTLLTKDGKDQRPEDIPGWKMFVDAVVAIALRVAFSLASDPTGTTTLYVLAAVVALLLLYYSSLKAAVIGLLICVGAGIFSLSSLGLRAGVLALWWITTFHYGIYVFHERNNLIAPQDLDSGG